LANAEILLSRSFLLGDIDNCKFNHGFDTDLKEETMDKVEKCLNAALRTTDMINEVFNAAENFKALWVRKACPDILSLLLTLLRFAHFCRYSAVVTLYVSIIRYPKTNKIK
jgi:hypothetical protein